MDKILRYENYISSKKVNEEYEIEGESEYKGTAYIKKLAEMLGVEAIGNEIDYKGQKINFYSETEKIHIGDENFNTPEEAYDYLTGEVSNNMQNIENQDLENIHTAEEDEEDEESQLRNDVGMESEDDEYGYEEGEIDREREDQDFEKMGQDINQKNFYRGKLRSDVETEREDIEEDELVHEYESQKNVKSFADYFAINEEEVFGLSKTEQTEKKKTAITADLNKKLTAWKSKNVKCDNNKFMSDAAADGFAGAVGYDKKTNSVFYMTSKQVGDTKRAGLGTGESFA